MAQISVGIAGATGYLGAELLRVLAQHSRVDLRALASTSQAGQRIADVLPQFRKVLPHTLVPLEPEAFRECDLVFLAAPHGVALDLAPKLLAQGNRVVDLSGDHRLAPPVAAKVYGKAPAPEIAAQTVYGLPELNADKIRTAALVANPGCYPTATALAALPLVKAGVAEPRLLVDAMSGVSGAGREPTPGLHFPEMNESARAYKVGEHRHEPEIAQTLGGLPVRFTPHIVPMNRGILATVHFFANGPALAPGELQALYEKFYAQAPFVRVVPDEPDPRNVRGTNFCDVRPHAVAGGYVVTSAIDNLTKGGSGQAVQNMNIMFGFPEATGLPTTGGGV